MLQRQLATDRFMAGPNPVSVGGHDPEERSGPLIGRYRRHSGQVLDIRHRQLWLHIPADLVSRKAEIAARGIEEPREATDLNADYPSGTRPLPVNVVFKLLNDEFLITDDTFHEVADRHDANHFFSFEHGQMAHKLVTHEGHALLDRLFGPHTYDVPLHDVPDRRCGRGLALEHDIARIVSLGDDADEFLTIHDDQRSDVVLGHFCDRIEHGSVRVNGANGPSLLIEKLPYRNHLFSPSTARLAETQD